MCDDKFEIAEQSHDRRTEQDSNRVRFDCDSKVSKSCGGCEEKRGEKQSGSENGSEDEGGCKKGPNRVRILLSSSAESEPFCEMANEWTPMPQPLVVDRGAAETVTPRTCFPNHKTA